MKAGPGDLQHAVLETTWGCVSIHAGMRGAWACDLPRVPEGSAMPEFRLLRVRLPKAANSVLRQATDYACAMVEGRCPGPPPALDDSVFKGAPPFQRAVWRVLRKIPRGRKATYAELARLAGNPRAARAAGGACRANPLPLLIPCHRIVSSSGRLGGFSAGSAWKTRLLRMEGAFQ